ncbi:hypothetical protein [Poseidonocella sedimentorum]|uniref:Phage tail protein (Tail_P2_I) n=1 Tax=Poseidonocella sedimentorum TaxID=871652 RepID=A0A1I6DPI8_9RHOB|nr:hypothetical protein [Poseidonocella sedimentorum]SFR07301.1 hypothetical protein SAMN04515673_104208 [Poseidonocella sedimentorum]
MTRPMPSGDWLYAALPEILRARDAETGEALRALLALLGEQGDTLFEEADRLYDNQFIETCEDWLVPYLGALVGYRPVHDVGPVSQRALVGRWIALTRAKGTAAALEEVARGATNWPAKVTEYFQLLAHPQFMNHIRPEAHGALDMRRVPRLEALGSAFDSAHYTVDTGRIPLGEGRHNVQNIGIALWRLRPDAWPRHRAFVRGARRFTVHPLGLDTRLFNLPESETGTDTLAGAVNLPIPLERRHLAANLAAFTPRAFRIWVDGNEVPPSGLRVCNLSDAGGGWAHAPDGVVAIDPVLGRINTPADAPAPELVEVEAQTALMGDLGGGAYERAAGFSEALSPLRPVDAAGDLQAELTEVATGGAVEITDSETYSGAVAIDIAEDQRLELRAANGQRPTLSLGADMALTGAAEAEITLNGLLIAGGALIVPDDGANALRRLTLRHVTLLPGITAQANGTPDQPAAPSLIIEAPNVIVELDRCILGGIRCHPSTVLTATDSIIDATARENIALAAPDGTSPAARVSLRECTVIGKISARVFTLVSNSLLDAALAPGDPWDIAIAAQDTQTGCARFSYIPPGARVPRRYRCQPSLARAQALAAAEEANPMLSPAEEAAILRRVTAPLRPGFTERRYGRAGYMQLLTAAPREIRTGADDESEMGAWQHIHQPQRESNLRARLDEFLPSGMDAGFHHET